MILTVGDVFYLVKSLDSCDSVTSEYDISLASFYAWNPSVDTSCSSLESVDMFASVC